MKLSLHLTLLPLAIGASEAASSSSGKHNLRGLQQSEQWRVFWATASDPNFGKCASTCTDINNPLCVGGDGQYDTVEECCTEALSYKCPGGGPCDECTNAPFTPLTPDTNQWYTKNDICVRNCETTAGSDCGGVNLESWSTKYASMEECCEEGIPWKCPGWPSNVCQECTIGVVSTVTTTPTTPAATTEYYVDWSSGKCVENCEGTSPSCGGDVVPLADGSIPPLFADVQQCCQASLSWKCPGQDEYGTCPECTDADVSQWYTAPTAPAATTQFYVQQSKCVENCDGPSPSCGGIVSISDTWVVKYADVQQCCQARLSWKCPGQEDGTCPECTDADVSQWYTEPTAPAATTQFYVDWSTSKCVENCEKGAKPSCGGVNTEDYVTKYDSAKDCCDKRLSWKCLPDITPCPACTDATI